MEIYLVGGAVRDQLLKIPVTERDWVVVGATVADMLALGYKQVGKDFPVFLHPKTQEEYALARTERKVGLGYTGFVFDADPSVSLLDDLKRRDLTINAMAQTVTGELIDPFHGQSDLAQGILRHVSPAFVEDPVRILRVARFAARFNFTIAPETLDLMRTMVQRGEVNALVPERVFKELVRGLAEPQPEKFFLTLAECGALPILFPHLALSDNDLRALKVATQISPDSKIRWAALWHAYDIAAIAEIGTNLRAPQEFTVLATLVSRHLVTYQRAPQITALELFDLLTQTDAFRRPARFHEFLLACAAATTAAPQLWFANALTAATAIDTQAIVATTTNGHERGERIAAARLAALDHYLINTSTP